MSEADYEAIPPRIIDPRWQGRDPKAAMNVLRTAIAVAAARDRPILPPHQRREVLEDLALEDAEAAASWRKWCEVVIELGCRLEQIGAVSDRTDADQISRALWGLDITRRPEPRWGDIGMDEGNTE